MDKFIDLEAGTEVDLVPVHGGVSCMATRAATARLVPVDECDSPDGILPRKAKAGEGSAVVEIITVYAPSLKMPVYTHDQSGFKATLADFDKATLVVPISMLKEHVKSDVRVTPVEDNSDLMPGIAIPVEEDECCYEDANDNDPEFTGINYTDDGYTDTNFDEFIGTLSGKYVDCVEKVLRQVDGDDEGKKIFQCAGLSDASRLGAIKNKYSSVLGDVFHAMDRTQVPVKHEAKIFCVALREAYSM